MEDSKQDSKKTKVEEIPKEKKADLFEDVCGKSEETAPQNLSLDMLLDGADKLTSHGEQNVVTFMQRSMFLSAGRSLSGNQGVEAERMNERLNALGQEVVLSCNGADGNVLNAIEKVKTLHIKLVREAEGSLPAPMLGKYSSEDQNEENEKKKVEEMRELNERLNKAYYGMLSCAAGEVETMLGSAPCPFAHVDTGHPALGDANPQNAFNSFLLLDQKNNVEGVRKYFQCYGTLFNVIMMNIGQTQLVENAKEESTNFNLLDVATDWKAFAPNGLQFKITERFVEKLHFGDQFVKFLDDTTTSLSEETEEALVQQELLARVKFVFGDTSNFKKKIETTTSGLQKYYKSNVGLRRSKLQQDLAQFGVSIAQENLGSPEILKRSLFHSIPMLIPHLKMLSGDVGEALTSSAEILGEFSSKSVHNLRYAESLVKEAKLKLYLRSDAISVLSKLTAQPIIDAIGKQGILDFFQIGIGLKRALEAFVQGDGESNPSAINAYLESRFDWHLHGEISFFLQDFEGARECLKRALKSTTDNRKLAASNELLGKSWVHSLKFSSASRWYEEAVKHRRQVLGKDPTIRLELAQSLSLHAQCLIEINTAEAKSRLNDAVKIYEDLKGTLPQECLKGLADIKDSEGWMFYKEGHYEASLASYQESRDHYDGFYKSAINHDTIKVRNGMALCYKNLKNFKDALETYEEVLKMKRALIGRQTADVNIASYLRFMGDCNKELGKYEEAEAKYKESISVRKCALGSDGEKRCSVATTMCKLSDLYIRTREWVQAARTAMKAFNLAKGAFVFRNGPILMGDSAKLMVKSANRVMETSDTDEADGLEMEAVLEILKETKIELEKEEGFAEVLTQLKEAENSLQQRFAEPMQQ
nr:uncharacterized protein LOC100178354 isoform X2 [Ciona intestinalis]|eukprot:XP_026691668.1 uncharacterized protein LOC100178354 isoform X2 [Ciona intestinalis]